jgi:hypothetical protein
LIIHHLNALSVLTGDGNLIRRGIRNFILTKSNPRSFVTQRSKVFGNLSDKKKALFDEKRAFLK